MPWNHLHTNRITSGWSAFSQQGSYYPPVSELGDLVITHDWTGLINGSFDLTNSERCTCFFEVKFEHINQIGIIQESGGYVDGLILYSWNGNIYFQAGNGSAFGNAPDRGECLMPIPFLNEKFSVLWSGSCQLQKINLYFGYGYNFFSKISVNTTSMPRLCGGNEGGIAKVHNFVAVNRGGWNAGGAGLFGGILYSAIIHNNQFVDFEV